MSQPTLTWATLPYQSLLARRSGGNAINALMVICTSGRHMCIAEAVVQAAHSAATGSCASTTRLLLLLPNSQSFGTSPEMVAQQTTSLLTLTRGLTGSVLNVVTHGWQRQIQKFPPMVNALSVTERPSRSGIQRLLSASTLS